MVRGVSKRRRNKTVAEGWTRIRHWLQVERRADFSPQQDLVFIDMQHMTIQVH